MNFTHRLRQAVPLWQIHAAAVVSALAIAGGAWWLGLRPIAAHKEQLAASRAELASLREQAADLNATAAKAAKRLTELEEIFATEATPLEPASRINRRIAFLTDLAQRMSLRIDEVQPGAITNYQHHRTVSIRVVGAGSYPDCAAFIHQLRDSCRDIGVRSLEISSENSGPVSPRAALRMDLAWFTAAD